MTRLHGSILAIVLLTALPGCEKLETESARDLQAARQEVRTLREKKEQLDSILRRKDEQIMTLMALGEERLEKLYHVARIELGRFSGGAEFDQTTDGDHGIKIYLAPHDHQGHAIKAAGEVTVQLYDLAEGPARNLIGEYHWSVDQLSKEWASGFMSYHYTLDCPWQQGPPSHQAITARVTFVDYLTGQTFTAQKICTVKLPEPSAPPAEKSETDSPEDSPAPDAAPADAPTTQPAE